MPWWVIAYLTVFGIIALCGIYDDIKSDYPALASIGDTLSLSFVFLFVFGYYHDPIFKIIESYILVMLALGIFFEVYTARIDLQQMEPDPELTEQEDKTVIRFGIATAIAINLPGYIFGVALLLR